MPKNAIASILRTLLFFAVAAATLSHTAMAVTITEFTIATVNSQPNQITTGPDGALWFTESAGNKIGRITTSGVITEFTLPTPFSNPVGITVGADGALWFADLGSPTVGRITVAGVVTEFPVPNGATNHSSPDGPIVAGPDGAIWFSAYDAFFDSLVLQRITTAGSITNIYTVASDRRTNDITVGPDGAFWLTDLGRSGTSVHRFTTSGTSTGEFSNPITQTDFLGITSGPDSALWFTESGVGKIARITTGGSATEFPSSTGIGPLANPVMIAAGRDGALWFTETDKIGRITTAGVITEFPVPTTGSDLRDITSGPDGALWFTENKGNKIGRLVPTPTTVSELTAFIQGITQSSQGEQNSLIAKLNAAQNSGSKGGGNSACHQLKAFINEVQAMANSGRLTAATVSELTAGAHAMGATLGCSS